MRCASGKEILKFAEVVEYTLGGEEMRLENWDLITLPIVQISSG